MKFFEVPELMLLVKGIERKVSQNLDMGAMWRLGV